MGLKPLKFKIMYYMPVYAVKLSRNYKQYAPEHRNESYSPLLVDNQGPRHWGGSNNQTLTFSRQSGSTSQGGGGGQSNNHFYI